MKHRIKAGGVMRGGITGPIFNVVPETDSSPAEIVMYGDICEARPLDVWTGEPAPGNFVALDEITAELDKVRDANEIVIRINSSGGDLQTGVCIHDQLRGFKGHKTAIVEGAAESAATLIMCAADTVKLHPDSMLLVHNPLCFLFGYYNTKDLDTIRGQYAAAEKSMRAIYAEKTGKSDDELQGIIDGSTWFIGQDAIDAGFADELIEKPNREDEEVGEPDEPDVQTDDADGLVFVAGVAHRLCNFGGSIPARVTGGNTERVEDSATTEAVEVSEGESEVEITSVEELVKQFPELTQSLVDKATADERERIKEIEAIEEHIGVELANDAKYGRPMTAHEAAYEAMVRDDRAKERFMEDLGTDLEDSGAKEVSTEPVDEQSTVSDTDDVKFIDGIAKLYNDMKGAK